MKHGKKIDRKMVLVSLCMVFVLGLFSGTGQSAEAPKKITFVSGTVGGAWYNSAAVVAQILMKSIPGLNVTATSGLSLGNIRLIDEGQDAQMGWTYLGAVFGARKAEAPFKKKLMNVRVLLPGMLGSPYFVCNKKSGVKDWADLKDKRITTAQLGGQNEQLTRKTLALYGITYNDIKKNGGSVNHVNFGQASTLMKDNRADCALAPAPPNSPLGLVLDLENSMDLVVPTIRKDILDKFCEQNDGYMPYPLSPMYKCLKDLKEPVMVAAGIGVIVTNINFPEDFIYKVAKAIFENREQLYEVNRMYNYLKDPANLSKGIDEELFHPGALKLIKEVQGK